MSENLKPRQSAVRILDRVLNKGLTVDMAIDIENDYPTYSDSDRHFIRLLILTTLRRLGQIDEVLSRILKRPLPRKQQTVHHILRLAIAQSLFLKTPPYAVVNTAVSLTRKFHFDGLTGLVNAVLRNLGRQKDPLESLTDPALNLPPWLYQSWVSTYGAEKTNLITQAILEQPSLDITVRENPALWAERWQGEVLPTGSVRVKTTSPDSLDGFQDGCCWVQNAAASVPVQLFTNLNGKKAADLCAAPGGKTAQMICRGAMVSAFDLSEKRLNRLRENMQRLGLEEHVNTKATDISDLPDEACFDAVLLDAPCSATGTIARHPEIKYHRSESDILRLAELQKKLLRKAIRLTRPGGEIVFATCSLQPEEGDAVVQSVLDQVEILKPSDTRWKAFLTPFGSLRFLPSDGYDGFYTCLLRKK